MSLRLINSTAPTIPASNNGKIQRVTPNPKLNKDKSLIPESYLDKLAKELNEFFNSVKLFSIKLDEGTIIKK